MRQGQLSRTSMFCSFFTDPLTTCKRHLPFLRRNNTPDHDFVRLCDKVFYTIRTGSPSRHLNSDVFYPVPKLCFIRESHLCRSLYFEKVLQGFSLFNMKFLYLYLHFRKTTFRQNTSFPFYNVYFSAMPNVSSTLLVLYTGFP